MNPDPPAQIRPRIGRALARRLDRLAFRAHAFHRWAHHPLCREYEGEVFRLGRRLRVCRGCTLASLGTLAGLAGGLLVPVLPLWALATLASLGALTGLLTVGRRRHPKLLTRALPMGLMIFFGLQTLRGGGHVRWAILTWAVATVAAAFLFYRRRGPDRTPCTICPEFTAGGTCRGFQEIRTRERAFARLASRWFQPQDPVR